MLSRNFARLRGDLYTRSKSFALSQPRHSQRQPGHPQRQTRHPRLDRGSMNTQGAGIIQTAVFMGPRLREDDD
jgi:hypothetical protein